MAIVAFSAVINLFWELCGAQLPRQFLLVLITIILIGYFLRKRAEIRNYPPTPWNLPLVGSLPWILWSLYRSGLPLYELLRRMKYTYGIVYAFNIFGQLVVVINDFKLIQNAFNDPHLNDRPTLVRVDKKSGPHQGIVLGSGSVWYQQRRFTQATFRSFGVGKDKIDAKIVVESKALMDEITRLKSELFEPKHLFVNAVSNVICSVIFGKRFEYSNDKFRYFQNLASRQVELSTANVHQIFLPFLRFFPSKGYDEMRTISLQISNFVGNIIRDHKIDFSPEHLRDYVDVYLKEIHLDGGTSSQQLSGLNEENMKHTIAQLFTAGTDTTAISLRWGILYMVSYPEIQARVQRELDEVVGRERLPMISDKLSLPYTRATILEIQRMASTTRLGLPHACSQTTFLCGYTIPKGAIIVSNIWAVHRDPEVWPDPEAFNPERFLDQNGELCQREELIPFSTGRRTCLGDNLARMELFIFITHLMHQFTFEGSPSFETLSGLDQGRSPKDFVIRATKRE